MSYAELLLKTHFCLSRHLSPWNIPARQRAGKFIISLSSFGINISGKSCDCLYLRQSNTGMNKDLSEKEKELASHLIDKYRESVQLRYEYDDLKERFELSTQVTREVIENLKSYFMECLYPHAEERAKMDEAFDGLNSFISHPSKTWRLLGNMTMAVLKFGHHFPMALKAGLVSLESYLNAKRFERDLLKSAVKLKFKPPISNEQFEQCITQIKRSELEDFTDDIVSLFKSMSNTKLLKKTIVIMNEVLEKMKKHPTVYSTNDYEGVEMGIHILQTGYDLFKEYKESLKTETIEVIRNNERWYLDKVYSTAN